MICRKPFVKAGQAFGCGQCLPCRINKRREWAHRIMLERLCHADAAFVTLTYDDEHLCRHEWVPTSGGLYSIPSGDLSRPATLVPRDLQLWLKRFRLRIAPVDIRFYAVGEYGEKSERPHYHVAVFGFPACTRVGNGLLRSDCGCEICKIYSETWGLGNVLAGELSFQSASYIAGYVTKKMTRVDDVRLKGRFPEFCRMSLQNGGIGSDAMWDVASSLLQYGLDSRPDVPVVLGHGKGRLPLARYLRKKLRVMIGRDEKAPKEVVNEKMQLLREVAFESSRSLAEVVKEALEGQCDTVEAYARVYQKEKRL